MEIITVFLLGGIIIYLFRKFTMTKRRIPPGPKSYPLAGSAFQLDISRFHEQAFEFAQMYGDVVEINVFNSNIILLNSVDAVNKAFCEEEYKRLFNDRPSSVIGRYVLLDKSILTTPSGKRHSDLRKVFTKGLHVYGDGKAKFEEIMKSEIRGMMTKIEDFKGEEFDFVELSRRSISNVISIFETRKPGTIRGMVDFLLDEQERELLEGREPLLTDDVIQVLIMEVIAAGIATTASSLPTALLGLINHPEYQTRIQHELDNVVGPNREPCVQDKLDHNCDFLEAVVLESLRQSPPAPLGLPHLCTQDVEFGDYQIKENSQVFANIFYIHHDEKTWGDPWDFRPERFLDDNGKLLPSSHVYMKSWIPFGIGRRKCPGISIGTTRIFLFLAHLLQKWTFIPPRKSVSCDPRREGYEGGTVLKPKPFYCVAKERK